MVRSKDRSDWVKVYRPIARQIFHKGFPVILSIAGADSFGSREIQSEREASLERRTEFLIKEDAFRERWRCRLKYWALSTNRDFVRHEL